MVLVYWQTNLELESLSFVTLITKFPSCLWLGSCLGFCKICLLHIHVHSKKQELLPWGTALPKCVMVATCRSVSFSHMSADKLNQYHPTLWASWFCLGGRERYWTKFYTGEVCPIVQPLTLLYTILDRKGTPFVYFLLTNGTPFTYLVYNTTSLNKCTVTFPVS